MPRIGAHMSVAGGLPLAIARAKLHECEALQIFTKNASQWKAKPLTEELCSLFSSALTTTGAFIPSFDIWASFGRMAVMRGPHGEQFTLIDRNDTQQQAAGTAEA